MTTKRQHNAVACIKMIKGNVIPACQSSKSVSSALSNRPLARYVQLRVAHALGMPGTFSPPSRVSDPNMHHGTCVTHVPWCMPGSLSSGFIWSRWRGKRSQHSRCIRTPQFYASGKRPMAIMLKTEQCLWNVNFITVLSRYFWQSTCINKTGNKHYIWHKSNQKHLKHNVSLKTII